MLTRSNRFHGHGSVRRVYRLGRPTRTALFSMHVLQGEKTKGTKVAVVVSRKVNKSAVVRNRIRRRIYEQVRPKVIGLKVPSELVITVYQDNVATIAAAELQTAIEELFKKARF